MWKIIIAAVLIGSVFCSIALAHDDLEKQIAVVSREIKANPKNAALYFKRAELRRFHGDWKNAEIDYDQAAALDSQLIKVSLGRGAMLLEINRLDEAEINLSRFLEKNPTHFEGLTIRGRIRYRQKRFEAAAADFQAAIDVIPEPQPETYLQFAKALAATDNAENLAAGLRRLDDGIKRIGGVITLQSAAVDLEMRLKNYDAAILRINRAMANLPRKESWLARRGEAEELAGQLCQANTSFAAALAALEAVDSERRSTPAMADLEKKLRGKLTIKPADCGGN